MSHTLHHDYVDAFVRLIGEGRPDRVRDVLLARIDGATGVTHHLVSPPLGRDEHDRVLILYVVYNELKKRRDEDGIRYFRQVLVEQLAAALVAAEPPKERIAALGRLIGYCRVADTPELAEQLRLVLWGVITTKLPKPFTEITKFEPEARWRALKAFDLWLAATPANLNPSDPLRGLLEPQVSLIRQTFEAVLKSFEDGRADPELLGRALLLLYRGVMKVVPKEAGKAYFWQMCDVFPEDGKDDDPRVDLRNAWYSLCYEYGKVFAVQIDWRAAFIDGVQDWIDDDGRHHAAPAVAKASLKYMGKAGEAVLARLVKIEADHTGRDAEAEPDAPSRADDQPQSANILKFLPRTIAAA